MSWRPSSTCSSSSSPTSLLQVRDARCGSGGGCWGEGGGGLHHKCSVQISPGVSREGK